MGAVDARAERTGGLSGSRPRISFPSPLWHASVKSVRLPNAVVLTPGRRHGNLTKRPRAPARGPRPAQRRTPVVRAATEQAGIPAASKEIRVRPTPRKALAARLLAVAAL